MTLNNLTLAKLAKYTSDRVCVGCDEGTYTVTDNALVCTSHACKLEGAVVTNPDVHDDVSACACQAGYRVTSTGASTADTVCEPCGDDEYKTDTSLATTCEAHGCPAGDKITNADDKTAGSACTPCDSSMFEYKPEGEANKLDDECKAHTCTEPGQRLTNGNDTKADESICKPCEEGSFVTSDRAAACEERVCGAGEYVSNFRTDATTLTKCLPCKDGEFKDQDNHSDTGCTAWSGPCTGTEYESISPTATSDRSCTPLTTAIPTAIIVANGTQAGEPNATAAVANNTGAPAPAPQSTRPRAPPTPTKISAAPPPADICNTITCAALCEDECGWSRSGGMCVSGLETSDSELGLGDCAATSEGGGGGGSSDVVTIVIVVVVVLAAAGAALCFLWRWLWRREKDAKVRRHTAAIRNRGRTATATVDNTV